jgi:hypothetical protein
MLNYLQKPASFNLQQMLGDEKWKFCKRSARYHLQQKDIRNRSYKTKSLRTGTLKELQRLI